MNAASFLKVPLVVGFGSLLLQALTALAADLLERIPTTPARDMVLWYRQPAEKWLEAMPLGNGLMVMAEDPKHHWLVTPFSTSPEHGYVDADGKMSFLSPSPTMDVAIIRELFPHCIEAGKILGVDEDFRGKLEAALKRIPPYQIDHRGYLQEWIEDWRPGGQGHNMSPNFTFYPGSSITMQSASELERRLRQRTSRAGRIRGPHGVEGREDPVRRNPKRQSRRLQGALRNQDRSAVSQTWEGHSAQR